MNDTIQRKLKQLPKAPGIYKMLDSQGMIIYIGKSKCLKSRVSSYFVQNPKWEKVKKMMPFIQDIEYTVTDTHLEAMLLECQLIKEIKPYFNVMMKNDQRYFYLKVEQDKRKLPLSIAYEKEADCFGPLRRKGQIDELIFSMRNLYPLVRKRGRIVFEYHIFPMAMDEAAFKKNRNNLLKLCEDREALDDFICEVDRQMKKSARNEKYEQALKYRDLAAGLSYLQKGLNSYKDLIKQDLVYAVRMEKGYKLFYISRGLVMQTKIVPEQSKEQAVQFLEDMKKEQFQILFTEKECVDYRGIVYTEILDAKESMITLAEKST